MMKKNNNTLVKKKLQVDRMIQCQLQLRRLLIKRFLQVNVRMMRRQNVLLLQNVKQQRQLKKQQELIRLKNQ
jgi:hypothetical protein